MKKNVLIKLKLIDLKPCYKYTFSVKLNPNSNSHLVPSPYAVGLLGPRPKDICCLVPFKVEGKDTTNHYISIFAELRGVVQAK